MKNVLFAMAVLAPALAASAQSSDVIWKGDFEAGASSLTGNCNTGQNQWCNDQVIRPQQIQVVQDPVVQGKYAARFEVRFGDKYNGYSDSRSLMTGPSQLWEDEGNERWYRWQVMWPTDYVGSYPKWDQLSDPTARSWAGSVVEWHHDAGGAVETGSAPLYIGADDSNIWLCLVDQATSACRENLTLAPLIRGHWHDFVMHAKWSSSSSVGFLEIWIDGVQVLPLHYGSNMYPGMRNYLTVGLYRNGEIGDPNLLYPNGTHVYGTDGAPGVVYMDGFIIGKTQASVLGEALLTDPAPATTTSGTDTGTTAPTTTATPASNTSAATAGAPANAMQALKAYGSSGCSSGGMPVWSALLGLAVLALRGRRRAASQA
jgi:uncharacterized protein (TIGR03382 family)